MACNAFARHARAEPDNTATQGVHAERGAPMDDRAAAAGRLDLHNVSIDFAAASAGRCGFTHLDSGRVCQLPHGHAGPCRLQGQRCTAQPEGAPKAG